MFANKTSTILWRNLHQAVVAVLGARILAAGLHSVRRGGGKLLSRGLRLLVAVIWMSGFSACDTKHTADIGNSKEMIAALSEKVPKGTPLAAAKAFMESEKFEVEELKKARWKGKADVTYLKCTRKDGSPPIFRQWEVAVINDGKVVMTIDARTALLYP